MHFRLAVLLVLAHTTPKAAQPNYQFFEPVQPPRATQVMDHRGMHMLAPENSLGAGLARAPDYFEPAAVQVDPDDVTAELCKAFPVPLP